MLRDGITLWDGFSGFHVVRWLHVAGWLHVVRWLHVENGFIPSSFSSISCLEIGANGTVID